MTASYKMGFFLTTLMSQRFFFLPKMIPDIFLIFNFIFLFKAPVTVCIPQMVIYFFLRMARGPAAISAAGVSLWDAPSVLEWQPYLGLNLTAGRFFLRDARIFFYLKNVP